MENVTKYRSEKMFVAHSDAMSSLGFALTKFDLEVLKFYHDRTGRKEKCFKKNLAGQEWENVVLAQHKKEEYQKY